MGALTYSPARKLDKEEEISDFDILQQKAFLVILRGDWHLAAFARRVS